MQKPIRPLVLIGFIACSMWAGHAASTAQMRVQPLDTAQGHVALGLALRHLNNTGIFLQATAHPDDENNGLLVMLNRGQGIRTALATATRGNGGQNEIGPEIFEALGVLRTEELDALHRFDGAEQYFTRAVDFGFSFSVEETFERWGRDATISDFVRLIRMVRPDVIVGMSPDGAGGGQHHQASALLSREAFRQAADPARFPEQIAQGLRPWQPKKYYFSAGFGRGADPGPGVSVDLAVYDPLLGRTYAEIGTEARSMHKCQGMAQLLSLPGPSASRFFLMESTVPSPAQAERGLFDRVDTTIQSLAAFAGAAPPPALSAGLSSIAAAVSDAGRSFEHDGDAAVLPPLLTGLRQTRALRAQLAAMPLAEAARFEIDFRLHQKEREFQDAVLLANAVRIDVLANDGIVAQGQPVRVSVTVANRGSRAVGLRQVRVDGFEGGASCAMTPVTASEGFAGGRGRAAPGPPPARP